MSTSLFRFSLILIGCVIVASCGGAGSDYDGLPSAPHPVIVVSVDGLRADHLGSYGATDIDTPNFDALAAESLRFEWAFAQASDPAVSMATILTGLYPTTSGVVAPGDRLPPEAVTLAEAFEEAGFLTGAFIEGVPGGDDFGLAQGFDTYDVGPEPGAAAMQWLSSSAAADVLMVFRGWSSNAPIGPDESMDAIEIPVGFFDRLQKTIASDFSNEPLEMDPADIEVVRQLYSRRIRSFDAALGGFMGELRRLGLTDRATLVLLGTTGMDLQQHGPLGNETLHATVTRVPLFVRLPGGRNAGTVTQIVELVDLMPTLLDLVGASPPPSTQGSSVLPLISGEGRPPYIAFAESTALGGQRAVALAGYRMVHAVEADEASLFQIDSDPLELRDIADSEAHRIEVLQDHLAAWQKMVAATSLDPDLRSDEPLDDDTLEQLKSLGYIQ